jgi:hypothetical protein
LKSISDPKWLVVNFTTSSNNGIQMQNLEFNLLRDVVNNAWVSNMRSCSLKIFGNFLSSFFVIGSSKSDKKTWQNLCPNIFQGQKRILSTLKNGVVATGPCRVCGSFAEIWVTAQPLSRQKGDGS